jgi:hypothetical protein
LSGSIEKVAIFSPRNIFWEEVGQIFTGYNIVKREEAEKWLTMADVREATPEEILSRFN